jgi:transcriptional regulator with XRE-family HTH domain
MHRFGEKLRGVRERKKLTLREVAGRAGLSESLVSQIERNKVSPSIDTLLRIIDILEIDLDDLLRDLKRDRDVNLVRADKGSRLTVEGTVYQRLSRTTTARREGQIEAYLLSVPPGGKSGSRNFGHPGEELGYILKGRGEITVGGRAFALAEGDSISFPADSPHELRNTGKTPLKAVWVVTPPKEESSWTL